MKLHFDLLKKSQLFPEFFLCCAPSKIAHNWTTFFHCFHRLGTDRFSAVDVIVMTWMAIQALYALASIAW